MATSLYDLTVPALVRGLTILATLLRKGEAFAGENGLAESDLLATRLIEDMAPLTAQIQRASDTAKGAVVRLGGVANVAMPDEEQSFADLQHRIAATIAFLETVPRDALDGKEDAPVTLTTPAGSIDFTGLSYAQTFVLPNFYFHMTTAYALMRMRGVPLGKMDYLRG